MLLLAVSDATATILALLLFGLLALLLFSAHRTTNRIEADDAEEKTSQRAVRTGSKATPELRSAVDLRCAIDSLKTLYDEYKYIELGELLDAIRADITSCKHGNQATLDAKEKLEALLLSDALPQIEARIRTCKDALAALSDAEGWELVNKKKEMRMFQRWREGNELQVKIEAVLGPDPPVRTADTIIVWREAQLYGRWFPMISSGFKIKEFSHCEVVIHLIAALNFMHCGECTTRIRSSTCGHAYHGCSLADGAFESRHPSWCFYREHTTRTPHGPILKDVRMFAQEPVLKPVQDSDADDDDSVPVGARRRLGDIILVDDCPFMGALCCDNVLPVRRWGGELEDRVLPQLVRYLTCLAKAADVRPVLRCAFQLEAKAEA